MAPWVAGCHDIFELEEQKSSLASIVELLRLAPTDVIALIGAIPKQSEVDALLEIGAVETLAARLVGNAPVGMMLSKSPSYDYLCTVGHPKERWEISLEGRAEAVVRVGAFCKFILHATQSDQAMQRRASIRAN